MSCNVLQRRRKHWLDHYSQYTRIHYQPTHIHACLCLLPSMAFHFFFFFFCETWNWRECVELNSTRSRSKQAVAKDIRHHRPIVDFFEWHFTQVVFLFQNTKDDGLCIHWTRIWTFFIFIFFLLYVYGCLAELRR